MVKIMDNSQHNENIQNTQILLPEQHRKFQLANSHTNSRRKLRYIFANGNMKSSSMSVCCYLLLVGPENGPIFYGSICWGIPKDHKQQVRQGRTQKTRTGNERVEELEGYSFYIQASHQDMESVLRNKILSFLYFPTISFHNHPWSTKTQAFLRTKHKSGPTQPRGWMHAE